jgi:DNA helicase-2/ATP-dependent DNA helicase PcrA
MTSHTFATVAPMDDLLAGLDARQRDAVTSTAQPLAILAPAGAGKTRVLTRRVAHRVRAGDADARHVLTVTFTRAAAGQLAARLRAVGVEGVTAGTFHALALAQLRRHAIEHGREPPQVLASKARILGPLVRSRGRVPGLAVGDLAAEIEWAKARMVSPAAYADAATAAGRRPPGGPTAVAARYEAYEAEKQRRRVVDFDDLLWRCAATIAHDHAFAASQRWRFRHLFVDEFQDATPLQVHLLRAWLGDNRDVCVVGDAAQAIYGFTGADATPLVRFAETFTGGVTIALDHNYRSTPQVVAVAEAALGAGSGVDRAPVRSVRPDGPTPVVRGFADDAAEARAVVQACWETYARGVPWDRMAILFRTNAQSPAFELACARRGIPVRLPESGRFVERPPVRALLDRLRAAERSDRRRPFAELLAELATVTQLGRDAADDEGGDGAEDAEPETPAEIELRDHRDALVQLGREYVGSDGSAASVAGFVGWLDLATRAESGAGRGVDLVTFHRAKGLEWDTVFVTGVEQGFVPISWARTDEQVAEEQRLLHVALSRATDRLQVTWAEVRVMGERPVPRAPSPWLDRIEARAHAVAGPPVDARRELDRLRTTLDAARPPQPVPRRARRG